MSHEIEFLSDGTPTTVLGEGESAWHGYGEIRDRIEKPADVYEISPEIGAPIRTEPVYARVGGKVVQLDDVVANVRTATERSGELHVGTVGRRQYSIVQPQDGFGILETFMDLARQLGHDPVITSASTLRGGRRAFMMCRIAETELIPGDALERLGRYVGAVNSYDASMSYTLARTDVRFVCSNTVQAGLAEGRTIKFRHTGDIAEKLELAMAMLGFTEANAIVQARTAEWLADTTISDATFEAFLLELSPDRKANGDLKTGRAATVAARTRDSIAAIYEKAESIGDKRGTAWGAYNAVTAYTNHNIRRMDTATGTAADNRFEALVLETDTLADRALGWLGWPGGAPQGPSGKSPLARAMDEWTTEARRTVADRLAAVRV